MEKKSREEIASLIKRFLEEKPLSIQELSQKLNSNWSTVRGVLDELKRKGKVREIISTNKLRVFKLARDDTYFGVPISAGGKKTGYFIFDSINKIWLEKTGKVPTKTDVYKVSVSVIDNLALGNEIPTVWYNFGKIPLLIYSPELDYSTASEGFVPENSKMILKEIMKMVAFFSSKRNVFQKRAEQYKYYHNLLYKSKERIYALLFFEDLDKKQIKQKLQRLLTDFYFYCPVKDDAAEVVKLVNDFIVLIGKMIVSIKQLDECKQDIYNTFDSLWRALAAWLFFDTLTEYARFNNREIVKAAYFENFINNKILIASDSISHLESMYLNLMSEPTLTKLSKEEKLMRDALVEMSRA